jgi:hypothetical protein
MTSVVNPWTRPVTSALDMVRGSVLIRIELICAILAFHSMVDNVISTDGSALMK